MSNNRFSSSIVALSAAILIIAVSALALGCQSGGAKNLTVWTYDSFVSEWGPSAKLAKLYAEKTGVAVEFVSKGDGGALLAELKNAGAKADADLVIGLDNNSAPLALQTGLFAPAKPANLAEVDKKLIVDEKNRLVPYDYGDFAFIWDSESKIAPPASLEDLTKPEYAKKVIIMDPRTSTPGLGLLAWTEAVYKDGWKEYWKRLAPSILAMTPGWDTGYGLFTKGEAPLVLSYSTSPAYHKAYENTERYKTLAFAEGHSAQIELAGVLAASKRKKDAEKFLNFLLSEEAQALLPETQWMYPANAAATLPASFSVVPKDIVTLNAAIADPVGDPDAAAAILSGAAR
jgi:thiamine transport system substrate-binding protein